MSDVSAEKPGNLSAESSAESFRVEDFEYDLPFELIAQEPLRERSRSRLLHLDKKTGAVHHHVFDDLVDLLEAGDVLILNNTKVIPARIIARRKSGGMIAMLLLKQVGSSPRLWEAMGTPIRRLKAGEILDVSTDSGKVFEITVKDFEIGPDGFKRLVVDLGEPQNVWQLLNEAGYAPLPPYIFRDYGDGADETADEPAPTASTKDTPREDDLSRYQTVFAKEPGAVAAPTAGLHFTDELLSKLREKGVQVHYLTLHVGAGTFKPISNSLDEHTIEPERFTISKETADAISAAKADGRRVLAVGTTSMRALETAGETGTMQAVENGVTHLFVQPGFEFKIVDAMITNFHLSKSSLLVLVSAFAGREKILNAYNQAIEKRYRFYSYGDAMLIL